jgi:hypothetical protein
MEKDLEISRRERSVDPRFQAPLEVDVLAMERIEKIADDLRREVRGVRKLLTIRLDDIERPHRKQNCLR